MLANSSAMTRTCTGSLPPYSSSALSQSRLKSCDCSIAITKLNVVSVSDIIRNKAVFLSPMITGEKNRAQNCLTVSNLKLDEVFPDVFGKSSRSITEQILQHPGEKFDVAPFVHGRCKIPIEEIQAAVDGAISKEQAVKLRQCLDHMDELNKHISEIEQEILRLSDKHETALNLIRTVPGFDKNPLTAIQVLSEILSHSFSSDTVGMKSDFTT